MSGITRALRVAGYVVLAAVAFSVSFFVGKKTPESGTSFLHTPYTYADVPYTEGGDSGAGCGDGGSGGCGGSGGDGGADGSGCGSSGGF